MRIENGKDQYEIIAYEVDDKVLGKGYIYPSLSSELYEKERVNIYITMEVIEKGDKKEQELIMNFIFKNIMDRAYKIREEHKDIDVRVYHCCFPEDAEAIDFYKKQEGFNHDEGMYVVQHTLSSISKYTSDVENLEIIEDGLSTDEEIKGFVDQHRKIFRKDPYTIEKIMELKKEKDFRGILILHEGQIVAASLLYVIKDTDQRIGWVEDMFVGKEWRRKGLGFILMNKSLNYFKSIGVDVSRLEVWSANNRALNLYYKAGYQLYKETEISIGKFL